MRVIYAEQIKQTVKRLIYEANFFISSDISAAIDAGILAETSPAAVSALEQIRLNYKIAAEERIAVCQDTGMCIVFAEVGQDAHIEGGGFDAAINSAVSEAYGEFYLRKSVVSDPLYDRTNTRDNTPAVIHARIVGGESIRLLVICKGFGSENMSAVKMLKPAEGEAGVLDFIVDTAAKAGANACPPMILGVCVGGTFEQAALYAKLMTARGVDSANGDVRYAQLERTALERINSLGIGPAGLGGKTTCLKVNIHALPTHIAGLPAAVNVCCHASRHAEAVI
ncbi:MAG: fumarate hydratase [Clostridia bacterium]|nr:fumarate hydratase [Clostridia bacterium]